MGKRFAIIKDFWRSVIQCCLEKLRIMKRCLIMKTNEIMKTRKKTGKFLLLEFHHKDLNIQLYIQALL